jgi:hypothetical protein
LKNAEYKDLSVDIGIWMTLNATVTVTNVTLLVLFNDRLEFIIVEAEMLETRRKRSNFDSNRAIKFGTYSRTLGGILKVSSYSTKAQESADV